MKKFRNSFTVLLVLTLLFSLAIPSLASDTTSSSLPSLYVGQKVADGISVVDIYEHTMSTEEVISYYVNEKGYTLEAATELALELARADTSITTRYIRFDVTDGLGFSSIVEVGCRVKEIHGSSGKTNFQEIVDEPWSEPVSSGIQDWDPFIVTADIVGATKTSIAFYSRGNVEILVNVSVGLDFDLLERLGFNVTPSFGGNYILRKTTDLEGIYTLPGYPAP